MSYILMSRVGIWTKIYMIQHVFCSTLAAPTILTISSTDDYSNNNNSKSTLNTWCKSDQDLGCWVRLKAWGEGDDRGWVLLDGITNFNGHYEFE